MNQHKHAQFQQQNASFYNPYMYNYQVPPNNHVQPHGHFPQPFSSPYMHNNQFGYQNSMPMTSINHQVQQIPMNMNHNPYMIPGPMIQMPQMTQSHLPQPPINQYKPHSYQNSPK